MIRIRNHAAFAIVSTLAAACAAGGGNGGNGASRYPASYSAQQSDIQQLAATRYDQRSIMQAQRALGGKGYDVGPIDGIWGPSSQSALRNFQQANGMTPDGRLGPKTLAALDVSGAGSAQARNQERDGAGATLAQAGQGRDNRQASRTGQRQGDGLQRSSRIEGRQDENLQQFAARRDDEQSIMQAQRALGDKGYDVGPIDGIWGSSSQSALRNFQQANGMTPDGRLGPETLAALDVSGAGSAQARNQERDGAVATQAQAGQGRDNQFAGREASTSGTARNGTVTNGTSTSGMTTSGSATNGANANSASAIHAANGEREAFYDTRTVLEVQRALASRGFEVGRVDGVWDPQSQTALRTFQQDQRLETTGRINERTLSALDVAPGAGKGRNGTTR